ncbi:mitochondrial respiratory chain complex I assembly [Blastocladiella emersonii ATCC 22665]|nr:mitochondrial respiratory chain complex I assembly [Blastocladiella emersonii ATCC 22665]
MSAETARMPVDPENRKWAKVASYKDVDLNDPIAVIEARDQHLRQEWVEIMKTRIIREKLVRCYKREGVNHPENCKHLAEGYVARLKHHGFQGMQPWRMRQQE